MPNEVAQFAVAIIHKLTRKVVELRKQVDDDCVTNEDFELACVLEEIAQDNAKLKEKHDASGK